MNRKKDIEQLFRQHYAKMYNLARCILSDDDESKDVVSEVFMMGLWFGATAIGNQLVMIPGIMWGQNFNLIAIWGVLAGICLVSALFIFSIIKKLNRVS